jgi:nucleoside phosphorylase
MALGYLTHRRRTSSVTPEPNIPPGIAFGAMRVALLAPMPIELRPLTRGLGLERQEVAGGTVHVGRAGDVEVVAAMTGIGTEAARRTAEAVLDNHAVDHLMVVGVAGGVGASQVRQLVFPEVVIDEASGTEHRPTPLVTGSFEGRLVTSDVFHRDPEEIAAFVAQGVIALDMETSAAAAACEARGTPWSVFRAISDLAGDPSVDDDVVTMAGADGKPDFAAVSRYLARRPWKIGVLARLGRDANAAAKRAATAAIEQLRLV